MAFRRDRLQIEGGPGLVLGPFVPRMLCDSARYGVRFHEFYVGIGGIHMRCPRPKKTEISQINCLHGFCAIAPREPVEGKGGRPHQRIPAG